MTDAHFADRLLDLAESRRSQVVVGLDPRPELLPEEVTAEAASRHGQGAQAAAEAMLSFNRAVIDATCRSAVAVKPQIAFYERYGCEGLRAYAGTVAYARSRGMIVIGDVKRGDIGSTAEAYAAAHLPAPPAGAHERRELPADFHVDAITVNPLCGSDGVAPFIERAAASGTGLFVLVRTSNPSSAELQDLDCGGEPFYRRIGALVERWGEAHLGACGYSLVGGVVGGTFPEILADLRAAMPHTVFLVPGFGAQGAAVTDVAKAFDAEGGGALVSSSRGIIYAYRAEPYATRHGLEGWREAIREAAETVRRELWAATHGT